MAQTLPTVAYYTYGNGSSTGYYAVTAWAATTAKTVGNLVRQLAAPTVDNERVFICIVAGTTGGSEPSWSIGSSGAKTTDSGATWQECTGAPAVNGDTTNTPLSSANRSSSLSLGLIVKNNTVDHLFIVTTAGSSGSSEPTWNTTTGVTTTDSGVTWTCIGTTSAFSAWGAPQARLANFSSLTAAPVINYVRSDHAETQSTSFSIDYGSQNSAAEVTSFLCVTGSNVPPLATDLTTGATVTQTGLFNSITVTRGCYYYGVAFSVTDGNLNLNTTAAGTMRFDHCLFGSNNFGFAMGGGWTEFIASTFSLGSSSAVIQLAGRVVIRDCPTPFALQNSLAHYPLGLFEFSPNGAGGGYALIENCDLSAYDGGGSTTGYLVTSNNVSWGKYVFSHCKYPSCFIAAPTNMAQGAIDVDVVCCDSAGLTYRTEKVATNGNHFTDTNCVISSGAASDGTTSFSWRFMPYWNTSFASLVRYFESMPIDIWNTTTGSAVNVTFQGVWNGTAAPTNNDIWLECVFLGTASSTLGTRVSNGRTSILASTTAQPTSTSSWTAQTRLNSHTYNIGDVISVSSNPGRVFICQAASGSTASSLPGAYATATDGTTVTDASYTFYTGVRFDLTVTLSSPAEAGYIRSYIKTANRGSSSNFANLFWINPVPVLS